MTIVLSDAALLERIAALEKERDQLRLTVPRMPFDVRAADALADEVAVLVRKHVLDPRSPAADALLDYRNPPSTPRADRLAKLEAGTVLTQAQTDILTKGMREAKAQGWAIGIEEAKREVALQPYAPDTKVGLRQQWMKEQIAARLDALGGDSSAFVVLPRKTVDEMRDAIAGAGSFVHRSHCSISPGGSPCDCYVQKCRDVLKILTEVSS